METRAFSAVDTLLIFLLINLPPPRTNFSTQMIRSHSVQRSALRLTHRVSFTQHSTRSISPFLLHNSVDISSSRSLPPSLLTLSYRQAHNTKLPTPPFPPRRPSSRTLVSSLPLVHFQLHPHPLPPKTQAQAPPVLLPADPIPTMASLALMLMLTLTLMLLHAPLPAVCDDQGAGLSPSHRTYIVMLRPPVEAGSEDDHRWWQDSFLPTPLAGSDEPRLIHTYTKVFTGFAVRLTEDDLAMVSQRKEFVRAFPDHLWHPSTTHTPKFLGLEKDAGLWRDTNYGQGVIIGVLDTSIYSEHPSFDDSGIPPPPSKWKGSCHGAARCSNKLIGAKFHNFNANDSRDDTGHGTHTSSTAAGNFVSGASVHGLGRGTAAGIAPGAHLAMYRVCTVLGCAASDILAGFDEAVKDGVDVLSISLEPVYDVSFTEDPVSIGALNAVAKGIVVVAAAGNNGPMSFVANSAPWLLTVAAGSVDRSFETIVQLGNGNHINGEALNQTSNSSSKSFPLYVDKHCKSSAGRNVAGKIVICHNTGTVSDKGSSLNQSDISGIMTHECRGGWRSTGQQQRCWLHHPSGGLWQCCAGDRG
ncbi:subtilisin-like protease 4 [Triticum dicoccoides]|uniref:subtilisin-like protease 4 n=1 Tax=Triticum dicoccoides TaxID=85692 RepID=UPI00188F05FE|nr:subtilisin-like protease 4 [Triticum dicoccoides]